MEVVGIVSGLLFFMSISPVAPGIITSFPSDPVVCYGGVSTLYCESNRSDINTLSWAVQVNGIALTTSELEAIGIHTENNIITEDNATAVISIPGSDDTNGVTAILCIASTSSFDFDYKSTTFTVTDIPPVRDLDVQFNDAVMIATWTAPSCLPVNYCYHVTVSNDTMTNTTTNTTSTQYQMLAVSSCVNYTISVTVMDTGPGGYESGTTNVTDSISLAKALTIESMKDNLTVEFSDAHISRVIIPLEFFCSGVSICSVVALQFTQELQSPNSGLTNSTKKSISIGPSDDSIYVDNYVAGPFQERFKANLTIIMFDNTEVLHTEISTFNVQDFTIEEVGSSILLTCVFASNSSADSCMVHFVQIDVNVTIPKHLNEDIASTDVIIPNGDYTVLVYDVVINGQPISISPAYTTRYTVTHVSMPSSSTATDTSMSTRSSADISTSSSSIILTTESELPKNEHTTTVIAVPAIISVVLIVCIVVTLLLVLFRKKQQSKQTVELHGEQALVQKTRAQQHNYEDSSSVKLTNTVIPPDTSNEQHSDDDDFEYHVPHHVSVRDTLSVGHSATTDESTSSQYVFTPSTTSTDTVSSEDNKLCRIVTSPGNATERVIYAELDLNTPNRPFPRVSDDTKRVYERIIGTPKGRDIPTTPPEDSEHSLTQVVVSAKEQPTSIIVSDSTNREQQHISEDSKGKAVLRNFLVDLSMHNWDQEFETSLIATDASYQPDKAHAVHMERSSIRNRFHKTDDENLSVMQSVNSSNQSSLDNPIWPFKNGY